MTRGGARREGLARANQRHDSAATRAFGDLLDGLNVAAPPEEHLHEFAAGAAGVLSTDGLAVSVMAGTSRSTLVASSRSATALDEIQFGHNEGPCIDAFETGRVVIAPDLGASTRWPAFGPAAAAAGINAVFAFPLRLGSETLGAMDLCRERAGPMRYADRIDAEVAAGIVVQLMLALLRDLRSGELPSPVEDSLDRQRVVHQASGIVAERYGISVDEGAALLRAHAWSEDQSLSAVATDVVRQRRELPDR